MPSVIQHADTTVEERCFSAAIRYVPHEPSREAATEYSPQSLEEMY
jgi:hypothetical protein